MIAPGFEVQPSLYILLEKLVYPRFEHPVSRLRPVPHKV